VKKKNGIQIRIVQLAGLKADKNTYVRFISAFSEYRFLLYNLARIPVNFWAISDRRCTSRASRLRLHNKNQVDEIKAWKEGYGSINEE
jgi:hypothetical protein